MFLRRWLMWVFAALLAGSVASAAPVKVLIVDGQNNHAWKETTPVLKRLLEETGLFTVDVATAPAHGEDMSSFHPDFASYGVVLSNYNGDAWPAATEQAFEEFIRGGGGFVSYHAADNPFPEWPAYQQMIAVGGWSNQRGSKLRWRDGRLAAEAATGTCGHHGARLPFQVTVRDPNHPIVKGLPAVWMHVADELYDSLCGPAMNVDLIASAHSDPANQGTGEEEPMLMAIAYGKGRVFHTTLGHDVAAMRCTGFIVTLQRGVEWAATGRVTQKPPQDFPTATQTRVR
jgi:uncharacterized protein